MSSVSASGRGMCLVSGFPRCMFVGGFSGFLASVILVMMRNRNSTRVMVPPMWLIDALHNGAKLHFGHNAVSTPFKENSAMLNNEGWQATSPAEAMTWCRQIHPSVGESCVFTRIKRKIMPRRRRLGKKQGCRPHFEDVCHGRTRRAASRPNLLRNFDVDFG